MLSPIVLRRSVLVFWCAAAVTLTALYCCLTCCAQSPTVQKHHKSSSAPTAARNAAQPQLAKAKAIERKIEAKAKDGFVYAQISPQNDFVLRVDTLNWKVSVIRSSDGKTVSTLPTELIGNPGPPLYRIDISPDERFLLVEDRTYHMGDTYSDVGLYECTRPFMYRLSKSVPEGGLSNAAYSYYTRHLAKHYDTRHYSLFNRGAYWAGQSHYAYIPFYSGDSGKKVVLTLRYDTRTGRFSKARKGSVPDY